MNRISGRVVVRESGVGIPDLLVESLSVDAAIETSMKNRFRAVLTKADGSFDLLSYDDLPEGVSNLDAGILFGAMSMAGTRRLDPEISDKERAGGTWCPRRALRRSAVGTHPSSVRPPEELAGRRSGRNSRAT